MFNIDRTSIYRWLNRSNQSTEKE
ncbi:MAG: hypothetical protein ACK5QS_11300 [Pseudanabaenaceae cyanobacterium]